MREIERIPWNGRKVVSTFSGAGGSCLGYRMAGFKVVWANEFIPAAQESYRANHPQSILETRDIRDVQPEEILTATGLAPGKLDIFDGSPPCESFSTSGERDKGWGKVKNYSDTTQRIDDLFFEYVRLLRGLQPKTFVAENVSGLIKGSSRGYFKLIMRALKESGYRVGAQLLNAAWLGVPQSRERLIFVGVREDLAVEPVHPSPLPYRYTVRDALGETGRIEGPAWTMPEGKVRTLYLASQRYGLHRFLEVHEKLYGRGSFFNHRRADWEKPSPTILAGSSCVYHPDEPRSLTIPEALRLSGFPDDFELKGPFMKQWERLGNCVPPVMMMHVAQTIDTKILRQTLPADAS